MLRVPNDKDNRSQLLSLTDAGRELVARIAPLSRQRNEALLSVLNPEEAEGFLRCLELVQRRAEAMLEDDDPG